MKGKDYWKKHLSRGAIYVFLIVVSFISVFPLYWAFISAFNNTAEILGGRMLPSTHFVENFKNLIETQQVGRAMINSFATSILQTLMTLLVCSIAGYGFEIYHDKYKDIVMTILMLAMMVPFVAILVPMFQMFSKMKLLNTWVGFFLPNISTPFMIMFFRNSARNFPKDTIEAARIDGLNELQIFVRMFVPMMRPTYAAAATMTFMNAWNAYLWPKVIMSTSDSVTMPMLVSNTNTGYVIDFGVVMMAVTLCSLPTVVVFFLLQKQFTNAVAGSVK
ncbi:MAG: carbohydrate ABC transporter permease [Clostridiales bacterium]|nr:carbohydrate ABC transporter permease [Clostridiales bacterium]